MKRSIPEINAGSMADIAFLLLIFFLVTTTMDVDTGISRKLPPPLEDEEEQKMDINERNIFKVLVNSADRLLVEDAEGDINTLREEVKIFFLNPYNEDNLSEQEEIQDDLLGTVRKSKGVVSLKNDRGTSYEMYIKVQNELTRAFREMRDDISVQYFGVKFDQLLDEDKIDAVQKLIPVAISEAEPEDIGGN